MSRAAVTIAVLTYRRPVDIRAALPVLRAQAEAQNDDVEVLVVDNDPEASARAAVDAAASMPGAPVRYEHEPRPFIPNARNRALDASAASDVLVFIDDDERPSDHWLRDLLATWRREGSTAVVGPVVSAFATPPEPWIAEGGFFRRRRLPTGTRVDVAATNNLLIDLREIRRLGLRFDPAMGPTGGEDMLFTRQLRRAGGTIVWCDEAVVEDVVPADRATRRWVTRRSLSNGNSWGLTSMRLADGATARALVFARLHGEGGARVAAGAVRVAAGTVTRRRSMQAAGVKTVMRGAGMVLGAWGGRYREYGR